MRPRRRVPEGGETLERLGERTVAVLRELGRVPGSGYFVLVTRAYFDLVRGPARRLADLSRDGEGGARREIPAQHPWRGPKSYRWVLEPLASFDWAREPAVETP